MRSLRALLVGMWCALPLAAQRPTLPSADPGATVRQLAARDGVQTELPATGAEAMPAPDATPRFERTGQAGEPRRPTPPRAGAQPSVGAARSSGDLGQLATALAWALVGVVGVLLVAALVRALRERRRRLAALAPAATILPAAAAPPPLADHELLAREGRFAEAVHALLLRAFVALAQRRGAGWPRAHTGREILAAVGGFEAGDAPLRTVFTTSESAWFGRAAVDRSQYDVCLASYRAWSAT